MQLDWLFLYFTAIVFVTCRTNRPILLVIDLTIGGSSYSDCFLRVIKVEEPVMGKNIPPVDLYKCVRMKERILR